jgi:hypothetical protein
MSVRSDEVCGVTGGVTDLGEPVRGEVSERPRGGTFGAGERGEREGVTDLLE